ncbi:glycoside hydrolase family 28 protein [Larkinella sp. VNQ87]|uniref:glycoside hydrolase family 28 protein n=1 Tax=Larkinella sp. VNQ87 TaxID=3400921 RepID=UPI003C115C47
MKRLFFLLALATTGLAQKPSGVWDVFATGAKGDGKTLDTKAIQTAIDRCHAAGGGKVYLHNGRFLSGTLYLKSHVTLYVEAGATLLGSEKATDYPDQASDYPTYDEHPLTSKAFLYAENSQNITIEGRGTIDGQGSEIDKRGLMDPYLRPSFKYRPRIIHLRGCENVHINNLTLQNSASWVQTYQACKNLVINGLTVDSRENKDIEKPRETTARHRNNDGLDLIDCEQVRISNCFINSGDDAICIKSFSPDRASRDITVTNCVVSANASGIKIGTETAGRFEDITIQNCTVFDTRGEGLAVMTADGARIERINISNITLRNIKRGALFIRLNTRNKKYGANTVVNKPALKDIIIENIQGTRLASLGCSITGLADYPLENLLLRNLNFEFEGGVMAGEAPNPIPEKPDAYPVGTMFGPVLPAYGFYVRHVKNSTFDQIQLRFAKDDQRPALVLDDVDQVVIDRLTAQSTDQTPTLIQLLNARNTTITNTRPTTKIPIFVKN